MKPYATSRKTKGDRYARKAKASPTRKRAIGVDKTRVRRLWANMGREPDLTTFYS